MSAQCTHACGYFLVFCSHVSVSHSDAAHIRVHWEAKSNFCRAFDHIFGSSRHYQLGDIHAINPSVPDFCLSRKGGIADSANYSDAHVPYPRTHRLFRLFRSKYVRYSVVDITSNIHQVSTSASLSPRSAYSTFVLNMMLILVFTS